MTITVREILVCALLFALVALSFWLDRLALPGDAALASLYVLGRHAYMVVFSISAWFDAPKISKYYPRFHRGLAVFMLLLTALEIGLGWWEVWNR